MQPEFENEYASGRPARPPERIRVVTLMRSKESV